MSEQETGNDGATEKKRKMPKCDCRLWIRKPDAPYFVLELVNKREIRDNLGEIEIRVKIELES